MNKKDHILAALRESGGWMSHRDLGQTLRKHGYISDARVVVNELIDADLCEVRLDPTNQFGKRQFRAKQVGVVARVKRLFAA